MLSFAAKRLARPLLAASDFIDSMVYVFVFLAFLAPFTSLMASLDLPLIDGALKHADHVLGFDWSATSDWVARHPMFDLMFSRAYDSIWWQAPLVLLIGSYTRPGERNAEAIWLCVISVLACIILSAALPAIAYPGVKGMKHIDELRAIRDGHWTLMSVGGGGIVAFPSFHAALAVIYIYSVRHYRWALLVSGPLNLVMLASTPTVGGHYLVDVIAGVAVAFASIVPARAFRRRYDTTRKNFVASTVGDPVHPPRLIFAGPQPAAQLARVGAWAATTTKRALRRS